MERKKDQLKNICRQHLRSNDIIETSNETEETLNDSSETEEILKEAVQRCVYLSQNQVTQKIKNMMKKLKVTVTALSELKLKPRMSSNQKTDMSIELKREILKNSELKWTSESDGHKATEIIMHKKLDEEIFSGDV